MLDIITCDQNSPEWYEARQGLPTASRFADLMTKGRGGGPSKVRQTYLMEVASEILTGEPMSNFSTKHTRRGHELEPEARDTYEYITGETADQVGFIKKGDYAGCSPDSLVGADGILEIKTKLPSLMVESLLSDEFPKEHFWQCMGIMHITGRKWVDLAIYWPGFPLVIKRLHRDEDKIAELSKALAEFHKDLAAVLEKARSYGRKEAA